MSKHRAEWAARLICDQDRQHQIKMLSNNTVIISEIERQTEVAMTLTTESCLLIALIQQIEKGASYAKD